MKRLFLAISAVLFAIAAQPAFAGTVYDYYAGPDMPAAGPAGDLTWFKVIYDTDKELTMAATLGKNDDGRYANGGWFVLSPGANPKHSDQELAIFYLDFAGRDVYAYAYNGLNNSASWRNEDAHIATYENVLNVTELAEGLRISLRGLDISAVQDFYSGGNWTGASFGANVGVWAHFALLDCFNVDGGKITEFWARAETYYDTSESRTQVPEPAGMAAFGLFAMGGVIAWQRRRRKAQAAKA